MDSIVWFTTYRGSVGASVPFLDSIPQDYVPLAAITVTEDFGGNPRDPLLEEAGRLGANAIIIYEDVAVSGSGPRPPHEPACSDIEVTDGGGPNDYGGVLLMATIACIGLDLVIALGAELGRTAGYRAIIALVVHIPPGR